MIAQGYRCRRGAGAAHWFGGAAQAIGPVGEEVFDKWLAQHAVANQSLSKRCFLPAIFVARHTLSLVMNQSAAVTRHLKWNHRFGFMRDLAFMFKAATILARIAALE